MMEDIHQLEEENGKTTAKQEFTPLSANGDPIVGNSSNQITTETNGLIFEIQEIKRDMVKGVENFKTVIRTHSNT